MAFVAGLGVSVTPAGGDDVLDYLPVILAAALLPPPPPCAQTIPPQAKAQGDWAALTHDTGSSIGAVAISNRGWRAVVGGQDRNVYLFHRGTASPAVTFATGGQVNTVDISANGSTFAAGTRSGHIHFFECDRSTPSWTYDASQDLTSGTAVVEGVAVSEDGRWVAAVSRTHVYVFRRDRATPHLEVDLGPRIASQSLATVAISGDGSRVVVGTSLGSTGSTVFYLSRSGVLWERSIVGTACGVNALPTAVAISRVGERVAAGGCDNTLYFWRGDSPVPQWTKPMPGTSGAILSVALSRDGSSMVVGHDNVLYRVSDTATAPDFSQGGEDWAWDGWLDYAQPSVYTGHDDALPIGPTGVFVSGATDGIALSDDGAHAVAADHANGFAYGFYGQTRAPVRAYHLSDTAESIGPVDVSPDASWIVMGGISGEILRIEVAPVELIDVAFPLTFRLSNDTANQVVEVLGGDSFDIDYTTVKPGRAADLTQHWELWALVSGVLVPPSQILCTGQKQWDFALSLADGDQVLAGTRELSPPQCLRSDISSVELFYLTAELRDTATSRAVYRNRAILASVQVGSGSP